MKKTLLTILLTAMCFSIIGYTASAQTERVAEAADFYDTFTDEHIIFYETTLAKRPVVSNINEGVLEKSALKYNISVDKLKKVLCVQHALSQCGGKYSVEEILNFQSSDLLRCARAYINWLQKNTTPEEFAAIAEKFKNIKA